MSEGSPSDSDRISGWKEIAKYLQRSVRSVQRWERELGLPVHRLQTLKGQVVYARRTELDAWMAANESRAAEAAEIASAGAAAPEVETREPSPSPLTEPMPLPLAFPELAPLPATQRLTWRFGLSVGVVALAVVGILWLERAPLSVLSRTVKLSAGALDGRDMDGNVVWSHQFELPASRLELVSLGERQSSDSVTDLDLDADGTLDHLVPVRFGSGPKPSVSDALFVFRNDGTVVWSVQPTHVLSCGGQSFEGPWQLSSVVVSSAPGPKRVWVAFHHHTFWPSFVVELTAGGEQSLRYVQAGWVMSLAEWKTDDGLVLAAGGVLNEHQRPSVVLVEVDGPTSLSPTDDPQFRCAVQDAVPPRQVSMLPTLEVVKALGHAYPMIYRVSVVADDLLVEVDNASALVTLRPDGRAVSYRPGDHYWTRHKAFSASGILNHRVEDCSEFSTPPEIRQWTPAAGWQAYSVQTPPQPVR